MELRSASTLGKVQPVAYQVVFNALCESGLDDEPERRMLEPSLN